MAGGRPTLFKPEYTEQVEKLCKLGATDVDLADFFHVDRTTIINWRKSNPEFFNTTKNAKDEADDKVEASLYQNATTEKNTTAQIFWLKNRRPKEWRDRREIAVDTVDSPFNLFITGDKDDGDTT